jgi:hypothetical protein
MTTRPSLAILDGANLPRGEYYWTISKQMTR